MADVIGLKSGLPIMPPGEPNEHVVRLAEDLLERARSGNICGLGAVLYFSDDSTGYEYAGLKTRASIAAALLLLLDLSREDG